MAWQIDRDYLYHRDPEFYRELGVGTLAGVCEGEMTGPRYRFRLRDDDGQVYYGGWYDEQAARADDDDPAGLHALWLRVAPRTPQGTCTTALEVKVHDAVALGLMDRDRAAREGGGWVSLFG